MWLATEKLNDRGVSIDQPLLARLAALAEAARADLDAEIAALTDDEVPRVSNAGALQRWLISRGAEVESVAKDIVTELLDDDTLDAEVRAVLELRADGGGSSSHKVAAIARQLSPDGRIRGALVYGGASATLRWSSHGAQLQNLPRHDRRIQASARSCVTSTPMRPPPNSPTSTGHR